MGPRLTATLAYFVAAQGLNKRGVEEIAHEVFGVPIVLGTAANLEREIEEVLSLAYEEAKTHLQSGPIKHLGETGWEQTGDLIDRLRNAVALGKLRGSQVMRILCSARWRAYDEHPIASWQLC